jgi:hypothetical protein
MKSILMCFTVVLTALAVQAQISNNMSAGKKSPANLDQPWTAAGKIANSHQLAPLLTDSSVRVDSVGTMHYRWQAALPMEGSKWETISFTDMKVNAFGNAAIGASRGNTTSGKEGSNGSSGQMDAAPPANVLGRFCSCTLHTHRPARFPLCSIRCP